MRSKPLEDFSTEALVEELQKRFIAIDKAKALLFRSAAHSDKLLYGSVDSGTHRTKERGRYRSGGTSDYARKISSLTQKIRHAKTRRENTAALENQREKLREEHKKRK